MPLKRTSRPAVSIRAEKATPLEKKPLREVSEAGPPSALMDLGLNIPPRPAVIRAEKKHHANKQTTKHKTDSGGEALIRFTSISSTSKRDYES